MRSGMVWVRRLVAGAVIAGVVSVAVARPAGAGGAAGFEADRDHYRTGERVTLFSDDIWKPHRDWRGPYGVWLARQSDEYQPLNAPVGLAPVPTRWVGNVAIWRVDDMTVHGRVSFTVPEVPDGWYGLSVCNPGCTDNLYWLAGTIFVGSEPPHGMRLLASPPPPGPDHPDEAAGAVTPSSTASPSPSTLPAPAPGTAAPVPTGSASAGTAPMVGAIAAIVIVAGRRRRRSEDGRPPGPPDTGPGAVPAAGPSVARVPQ
jgi:hypothetical protein